MFYLSKYMFDTASIFVATHSKSELKSAEYSAEISRIVDEESDVINLLLLVESSQEQHSKLRCSCLKQPYVEEFDHVGIDGGV